MQNMTSKAALVAAMAAGLFSAAAPLVAHAADSDMVHCQGVNSCKGTGSCKGKGHSCAGKNSCKGKGWMEMTQKECAEKGGKAEMPKPAK